MTAEEFFTWGLLPENVDRTYELVRGEVVEMPRPTISHGAVCAKVTSKLDQYCETHSVGIVVIGSGVILGRDPDTVRGPDVAIYTGITFATMPKKWSDQPPLLAVEIRSPNDRNRMLTQKISDYLTNGVREVWLLDFEELFLTVYRSSSPLVELGIEDTLTSDNLPGFECRVGLFFGILSSAT